MMAINWKSILVENKDLFFNINNEDVENAKNFLGAKPIKENNTILNENIFEYYISDINAKMVFEKTLNLYNFKGKALNSNESEIISLCKTILEEGQNPVEMFLYTTKAFNFDNNDIFKSLLRILICICNSNLSARNALINVLNNWTWDNQLKLVVETIRTIKERNAYDSLIPLLKNDNIKFNVAECLIDLGDERCIEPILDMTNTFNGFNVKERNAAFWIIDRLTVFGINAVSPIIKHYINNENKSLNTVYSNVISRSKDISLESLNNLLYSEEYNQKAAITLGKMRMPKATKYLIDALNSPSIKNKINIIIGLGYTKDENAIEPLVDMLRTEVLTREEKASIITSLANLEAYGEKDTIKGYINDKELAINAMSALVQLNEIRYLGSLFKYLVIPDKSYDEVSYAIKELKRLKGIRDSNISKQILDGIKFIIRNDDGYACLNILRILDTNIEDDIAKELIMKLNNTKKEEIQYSIYKILSKNTGVLNNIISERIFVDATSNTSTRVRYLAQKIIEKIYKDKDKLIKA